MDKQYTTQASGYAGSGLTATEDQLSPVQQALADLRRELINCHYEAEFLIGGIGSALREPAPTPDGANKCGRPVMASDLAEQIQQQIDSVEALCQKLRGARERLTL